MRLRPTATVASLALAMLAVAAVVSAQGPVDRRAEARRAFTATPRGLYMHYCANCHGERGDGKGLFWDARLSPAPTDFTTFEEDEQHVLDVIRGGSAVHEGRSNLCPPWGRTIEPDRIERLAQYVLSLGPERGADVGAAPAGQATGDDPFPWLLLVVIAIEVVALYWLFARLRAARPGGASTVPSG